MELNINAFATGLIDSATLRANLNITNATLNNWRHKKGFPAPISLRRNGRVCWRVADVNAWIEKQVGEPVTEQEQLNA